MLIVVLAPTAASRFEFDGLTSIHIVESKDILLNMMSKADQMNGKNS